VYIYYAQLYMCPHTSTCVLIQLYMCSQALHASMRSGREEGVCAVAPQLPGNIPLYVSSHCILCMLLYMCPHTSSYTYYYICVLILHTIYTTVYVSSYFILYILSYTYMSSYYYMLAGDVHVLVVQRHETDAKVLILLYMCPHTTIYVSS
jgi:hypothetical protein